MNIEEFKTITIDDYLKAVDKVITKKKSMFEDFRDASPKFKAMIYWLLRKIYEEGDIPEEFLKTNLVALFKKGDPQLASNYRYIHLKVCVYVWFFGGVDMQRTIAIYDIQHLSPLGLLNY